MNYLHEISVLLERVKDERFLKYIHTLIKVFLEN